MASYQDGVPIEKNDVKGGVPVEEKENNVNNINREVFQYIISRGSIVGGIIYIILLYRSNSIAQFEGGGDALPSDMEIGKLPDLNIHTL